MSALTFQPLSLSVLIISFKCKFTNIKLFSDGQINTVAYTACLSARPRQDRAQDVEQFVCGRGDEAGRRTHTCTHTQFKYENISGNCFKHANRELVLLRFYCTSLIVTSLIWLVFDGEVMNFTVAQRCFWFYYFVICSPVSFPASAPMSLIGNGR